MEISNGLTPVSQKNGNQPIAAALFMGKFFSDKGIKAQPDRAATNGGTLEARRAGTNTAV